LQFLKEKKKNPGSGYAIRKNDCSESALNHCGSETQVKTLLCLLYYKEKTKNHGNSGVPKTPETYRYTTKFSCFFIERRLSAPGLGGAGLSPGENNSGGELSFLAAETRSLMRGAGDLTPMNGQQASDARLHGASSRRLLIGHPSSASGPMGGETGFPLASRPHMRGPAGGQMGAAHYRRFQDSSFSSFRHCTQSLTQ
jgi:hypothetical protein